MAELEVHDVGEPKEDDRLLNNRTPFLYYQGYDESNAVNKEQIPGWQGQNSKIVIGKPGLLHSEVERAFLNGRTVDEVHAVAPWKGAIYSEPGLKKAPYYMFFGRDDRMPPDVEQEFARRGYVPKGTDPFKFGSDSDSEWTFSDPNVTIHEPTGGVEGEGRVPYLWYYHPFDWNDQHVYLGAPNSYHDEIMATHDPYVPDREWDAMHPQEGALMDDYEFGGTGAVRDNRVYDLGNGRGYLADDFEPVGYDPYDEKPEPVNSPPPTHVLNAVQQHFGPPQGEQEIPKFGSIIDRSPYVDEIIEHINGIVPPETEQLSPHKVGFGQKIKSLFLRDRVDHHDNGNADDSVTQHCAQNVVYRNAKKENGKAEQPNNDASEEVWDFHASDDSTEGR